MTRLAVVTTHPIQYYAPWFRRLASHPGLDLRVFYLWDFGVVEREDKGFGRTIRWDVPLLDGYASEFVPNVSRRPGITLAVLRTLACQPHFVPLAPKRCSASATTTSLSCGCCFIFRSAMCRCCIVATRTGCCRGTESAPGFVRDC